VTAEQDDHELLPATDQLARVATTHGETRCGQLGRAVRARTKALSLAKLTRLVGLVGVGLVVTACGGGAMQDAAEGPDATAPPVAEQAGLTADEIPVASTPEGGWTDWPEPVLTGCTEPLVDGAPDLRGRWRVTEVIVEDNVVPDHPAIGREQRIEQCGNRIVITASGIIHDSRADGTEANGVNDVAERDKTTPITVVSSYEDGVHVLRPAGVPVEVRRRIENGQLVWDYIGFTARLDRVGEV
jgi:hypothetical protein